MRYLAQARICLVLLISGLFALLEFHCKDSTVSNGAGLPLVALPRHEDVEDLQFVDGSTGWLLSATLADSPDVHLFRTDDGGHHWVLQKKVTLSSSGSISFSDRMNGWLGSAGRVFHTTNGGYNWSEQSIDSLHYRICAIQSVNQKVAWLTCMLGASFAYLFQTTDGGITWMKKYDNLYGQSLRYTTVAGGHVWSGGGGIDNLDDPFVIRSTDSGRTWGQQTLPQTSVGPIRIIKFLDPQVGFCGGWGPLRKTTDGGLTWRDALLRPIYDIAISDDLNARVLASDDSQLSVSVYRTSDGGRQWSQEWPDSSLPGIIIRRLSFLSSGFGFAAGTVSDSAGVSMFVSRCEGNRWTVLGGNASLATKRTVLIR